MISEAETGTTPARLTDDPLKTAVDGGLIAFLVLGLIGLPLLGGLGAVGAAAAGVALMVGNSRS